MRRRLSKTGRNQLFVAVFEKAIAMASMNREGGRKIRRGFSMKKNKLGRTDIEVTDFCLGSMTWGTQNTAEEGHAQIERALDAGINFIDTAEMYPVNPVRAETMGRTEEIIGEWIGKSARRSDFVLASKHSGEGAPVILLRRIVPTRWPTWTTAWVRCKMRSRAAQSAVLA